MDDPIDDQPGASWPRTSSGQYTHRVVLVAGVFAFPTARARRRVGRIVGAILLAWLVGTGAEAPVRTQAGRGRVIAVGDIHGAADRLTTLLQQSDLVDDQGRWIGGTATIVQTGDFTDRGPQVRDVMDLLRQIEESAMEADGEVRVLLGNHETMNLTANVRDATDAIFASFASNEAERRREQAYERYLEHAARRWEALGRPVPALQSRDEWMTTHPPGFVEYMEEMSPDGEYGRWLRQKPIATVVDDTIFVHGGLAPELVAESVDALNDTARQEIARFDAYRRHLVDRGIIMPFSTFQEIFVAATLELNAWIDRLFPGPPAPDRPPPSLTAEDRTHLDLLIDLQTIDTWSIIDSEGPVWFRGFARWSEEQGNDTIGGVLARYGVTRAVVEHSVTASRRITGRFGDRVILIDTGMLEAAYRGRASALEFLDGRITAIYVDERVPLGLDPTTPSGR